MLAFLSKQNTASLPGAILLVEYVFFDRTWQGWKKKLPWFVLSFVLWVLFILYVSGLFSGGSEGRGLLEDVSGLMQETETVSRWQYLFTQFNVLIIYIRLLFLPVGQNFDYLYPFKSGFFDSFTPFALLFLIGLAALGTWQIKKRPIISLAIFWFFITLTVESSIIPIRDALFEHRLYLPMFGFALIVAFLLFNLLAKQRFWAIVFSVVIIMSFGTATYYRNSVWKSGLTLWSDVVSKSPYNYRAHYNLGFALADQDKLDEAISHYSRALQIDPDFWEAHNNLGNALVAVQGPTDEAIGHFIKAIQLRPRYVPVYNNLGPALIQMGKIDEALVHLQKALQIDPDIADTHFNLGIALLGKRRIEDAIVHFGEALRIKPSMPEAHVNLGTALINKGEIDAAITHFREALRLEPGHAEAQDNLNKALAIVRELDAAIADIKASLKLYPQDSGLHYNLGILYQRKGKLDAAIDEYQQALSIEPEFIEALNNLALTYMIQNENDKALALFNKLTALQPDNAGHLYNLACIYSRQNQIEASIDRLKKAVEKGFSNWNLIKTDKDLENIRGSSHFQLFSKGQ